MHPSVKGWKNGWQSFGDALLPLQGEFPEVIALMRYLVGMVSTNHSGSPVVSPRSSRGGEDLQWGSEILGIEVGSAGCAKSVLFIPLFSRRYCLGSCLKVAEELHLQNPEIRILIVEPQGEVVELPSYIESISMSSLRKAGLGQLPGAALSGVFFWRAVCRALDSQKILRDELTRVYGKWKRHLLKWCCAYRFDEKVARDFLKKRGIGNIITINDVVKPAAPLISAGNWLGLHTVVLQHGVPGPQSAPFLANEGWVWGETSQKALEVFGADPSRLKIMGGLETEGVSFTKTRVKRTEEPRTLLFLGQWRAARGWGEPFFQEVFDLLCEVLSAKKSEWRLLVRLHPTDPEEAKVDILSRLEGLGASGSLGSPGSTMEEDLADADALLSISSSGLMSGVSSGIPTAQIFPEDLEQIVGPALLGGTALLRDQEALENWLRLIEVNDPSLLETSEQVLANRGEVARLMATALL